MAKSPRNNNKGYFLIELMIAISILTIGFMGFLTLVSRSISTNRVISDYLTANYLAAEGIELIKNTIDTNYFKGNLWYDNNGALPPESQLIGDYEMDYDDGAPTNVTGLPADFLYYKDGFYNYDISGSRSPFKRTINISYPGVAGQMKVKSTVSWIGRGGNAIEIYLEDYFFDWR
ncbi:MAG: prepilin-type N-terminal cleavage/methylation domain-containing protein [Patescibacteria group bacterium]